MTRCIDQFVLYCAWALRRTCFEILLAIENERRIEFAFEPHRWFDLVRTGRAAAVLNITDANKLLLPIPAEQRLIDKALDQNPGY